MEIGSVSSGYGSIMMQQMQGMRRPDGPPPDGMRFNGQGKQEEHLEKASSNLMEKLDIDGDGTISLEESGLEESAFNELDTDGDGMHSQDEMEASLKSDFESMMAARGEMGSMQMSSSDSGISMQQAASAYENVNSLSLLDLFSQNQNQGIAA